MTRVKLLLLEFHADGLANEKALLPYVEDFGYGTSSYHLAVKRNDCPSFWCNFMQALVDVDTEDELDAFWKFEPMHLIMVHLQLVE